MPIKLVRGSEEKVKFTLPDPQDDDFDSIHIKISLDSMEQFTEWDASSQTFTFELTDDIDAGLYFCEVTLDDSQIITSYQLSVYISEPEDQQDEN